MKKVYSFLASIVLCCCLACSEKDQMIEQYNLEILSTSIEKICNRWKKDTTRDSYRINLINYPDEDFLRILEMERFENPEFSEIFTPENMEFFKEQLEKTSDDHYTKLLPRNDCYRMKSELKVNPNIPPSLYSREDLYLSKVIFTKDMKYALWSC